MPEPQRIVPIRQGLDTGVYTGGEGRTERSDHSVPQHLPPLTASEMRLARWMRRHLRTYGATALVRKHGARAILDLLHDGIMLWDDKMERYYPNPDIKNPGAFLRFALGG